MLDKEQAKNKAVEPEVAEVKKPAPKAQPARSKGDRWVLVNVVGERGLNLGGDPQRRLHGGSWAKVNDFELRCVQAECGKGRGTFVVVDTDPTKIPLEG